MNGEPSQLEILFGVRHLGRGHVGVGAHEVHAPALEFEVVLGEDRVDLGQGSEPSDVFVDVALRGTQLEQHRLARHPVAGRTRVAHRDRRIDLDPGPLGEPGRQLLRVAPPGRVEFDRLVAHVGSPGSRLVPARPSAPRPRQPTPADLGGERNVAAAPTVGTPMTAGHRITITPATNHVEITVDDTLVAESDRPVLLDETGLPTRYYLPRTDVREDLLVESASVTSCPFKGQARYWSVKLDDAEYADLAWSYEEPIPDAEGITGLVCFYNERVDMKIDGEALLRPETPYSTA